MKQRKRPLTPNITVAVNADLCIGCGRCTEDFPDLFEIIDDLAHPKQNPLPAAAERDCSLAAKNCPIRAIHVSQPG